MTESTRAALVHLLTAALRLLTEGDREQAPQEEWRPRFLGDVNPNAPSATPDEVSK